MHKWADMAKLAKTGGEASAMAVRIAEPHLEKIKLHFAVIMAGMIGIYQRILKIKIILVLI